MPRIRPRVISPCVADRYSQSGERIVEFAFPARNGAESAGGLISLRRHVYTGAPIVEVYNCEGVDVRAPGDRGVIDAGALDLIAELLNRIDRRDAFSAIVDAVRATGREVREERTIEEFRAAVEAEGPNASYYAPTGARERSEGLNDLEASRG